MGSKSMMNPHQDEVYILASEPKITRAFDTPATTFDCGLIFYTPEEAERYKKDTDVPSYVKVHAVSVSVPVPLDATP